MFANKHTQFGCAQCDADIVRAPVVEFVTRQEMVSFIQSRLLKRFVMIPEFLFYDQFVLSKLESANVAGLVVYPGDSFAALNESGPQYQTLPSPPVEDLSTDTSEPNLRHNYYPKFTSDDDSTSPDYRNPENILENIRKQASNESLVNVRNAYGTGLKYRFLRYSVFHISKETASEIREFFNRFGDTGIIGAQRLTDSDRSPTTPQYQLESIGRMYACPSQTSSPSPSPSPTQSKSLIPSTSPSPSISATPELDGPDPDDFDPDDDVERMFGLYSNVPTDLSVKAFEPKPSVKDISLTWRQNQENTNPTTTPTELPTTDANICLADKTCLPIGGQSVWSSLGRLKPRMSNSGKPLDVESEHSVIAVTAPMDSIAFFPDLAYGASAEISSLAVLLAVAEAVGNYWRKLGSTAFIYQPVYMALNAQSWGWAGSSRLLKDLSEFSCNNETRGGPGCDIPFMGSLKFFDLRNLSRLNVINIGQLISPNAPENFNLSVEDFKNFYFDSIQKSEDYSKNCDENSLFTDFDDFRKLSRLDDSLNFIDYTSENETLYPLDASQSFRKYYVHNRTDPSDCNFKIISVNNFQVNFTNRYYHSIYDVSNLTAGNSSYFPESSTRQQSEQTDPSTSSNDYRKPMYLMAKVIAQVVARHAFGEQDDLEDLDIKSETVDKVITCMTGNWSICELKDEYLGQSQFQFPDEKVSPGNYAGSFFPSTRINDLTPSSAAKLALLQHMFAYFNRYYIAASTSDDVAQSSSEPEDSSDSEDIDIESSPSPNINCTTVSQCADLNTTANSEINHQTEWQNVFCSRETCVLSDTYLHDAFGSAIQSENGSLSKFRVEDDHDSSNTTEPEGGSWTESGWDEDLGLCGYVEDTKLYGGLILGAGVIITIVTFFVFLYFDKELFSEITVSPIEETPLTSQPVPP